MDISLQAWRQNPLKLLDRLVDMVTMYRLVLDFLIVLVLAAAGLGAIGVLAYSPWAILLSTTYLLVICRVTNGVFAYVFATPANAESSYITALILALLITPVTSLHNVLFLTAAGGLAVASKYVLAWQKRHLFNPVAIALLLLYFGAGDTASWWVGNAWLMPLVAGGGLLIARKIQRLRMVLVFFAAALISTVVVTVLGHGNIVGNINVLARHSSLLFLGFVMLTEPLTAPLTSSGRYQYAALVGLLFPPQLHLFGVYSTPELALVVGNAWAYIRSAKVRLLPKFQQKLRLAPDIADFVFTPERPFPYRAGQYVEVTLGHDHTDLRGNRRMLTLASAPTEASLRFGIKFYAKGSSFKRALLAANEATHIAVSPPAGDFVLPKDQAQKLTFIAGGIGITPYRSMIKYLLDSNERRDVILMYAEKQAKEFVYTDVFDQARRQLGIRTVYAVQQPPAHWHGRVGYITAETIAAEVPDYHERLFYLSGPLAMITAVKAALHELGVPGSQVKTDYFSGYTS